MTRWSIWEPAILRPLQTLQVRAPLSGVITERPANVGLNVDPTTPLATIVDLSSVWVVADVYEADSAGCWSGCPRRLPRPHSLGCSYQPRVNYIDPQVSPDTRTAKVRIEVPNPRQELRLGMLAEARLGVPTGVAGIYRPAASGPDHRRSHRCLRRKSRE